MKSSLSIVEGNHVGFPRLCKHKESNFTVLFSDYTEGTVVHSESPEVEFGKHRDNWISCKNEEEWYTLPVGSKVTLTQ